MITDPNKLATELRELINQWWDTGDIQRANIMNEYEHEAATNFISKIDRGLTLTEKQLRYANALIAKFETYSGDYYRPSDIGRYER